MYLEYTGEANTSYTDSSTASWSTDSSACTLTAISPGLSSAVCTETGDIEFTVTRNDVSSGLQDSFFVTFSESTACYAWYPVFVAVGDEHTLEDDTPLTALPAQSSEGVVELRMWLYNPSSPMANEGDGSAVKPGSTSFARTREFKNLGEVPTVHQQKNTEAILLGALTFNSTYGFWQAPVTTHLAASVEHRIEGEGVSVLGCSVRNTTLLIGLNKHNTSEIRAESNVDLSTEEVPSEGYLPHIAKDACEPTSRLFILNNSQKALFTKDGFKSTTVLDLSSQLSGDTDHTIISAALSESSMVFLTTNGVWVLNTSTSTPFRPSGIEPTAVFSSVYSNQFCDSAKTPQNRSSLFNSVVVVYNGTGDRSLFLSNNSGSSFQEITIPDTYTAYPYIYDVVYSQAHRHLMLILGSDTAEQLVIFSMVEWRWESGFLFADSLGNRLSAKAGSHTGIIQMASTSGELFLYGDSIYYSADGGYSCHELELRTTDEPLLGEGLQSTEYIVTGVSSRSGGVAVLTSERRVFFTFVSLSYFVEIEAGIPPKAATNIAFDIPAYGVLSTATASAGNGSVSLYHIPLENELNAPKQPVEANEKEDCPYLSFLSNVDGVHYLDMNEQVTFEASLVTSRSSSNQVSVLVSDRSQIAMEISDRVDTSSLNHRVFKRKVVVSDNPDGHTDRLDRLRFSQGITDLRAVATSSSVTCENVQYISTIRVGCPPNRHIRIRTPTTCSSYSAEEDRAFVTPSTLDAASALGVPETQYSYGLFGCHFSVYHQTTGWKPIVDLYEGDKFIREMDGDYVIWELAGRSDFTYNATVSDVKCKTRPTFWRDIDDGSWDPEDTKNCYDESVGEAFSGGSTYPVLNNTGSNYIKFSPTGDDGQFLFRLRVIDPDYSYCHLEAYFALSVFGAPLDTLTALLVVFSSVVVIVLILVASYFHYRSKMILKKDV